MWNLAGTTIVASTAREVRRTFAISYDETSVCASTSSPPYYPIGSSSLLFSCYRFSVPWYAILVRNTAAKERNHFIIHYT